MTELFDIGSDGAVYVRLQVQPGAGRTGIVGRHGDALKVKVAAPPTGGRANAACSELIAEVFGVTAGDVTLTGGEASRSKRFKVANVDADDVPKLLERALAGADSERKRGGRGRF